MVAPLWAELNNFNEGVKRTPKQKAPCPDCVAFAESIPEGEPKRGRFIYIARRVGIQSSTPLASILGPAEWQ